MNMLQFCYIGQMKFESNPSSLFQINRIRLGDCIPKRVKPTEGMVTETRNIVDFEMKIRLFEIEKVSFITKEIGKPKKEKETSQQ